ncbi:MAG: glycosyltransferase [Flavobacteriales bacterium]|nr:glycosyltransferase [Flavobacteriales bacterium]
MKKDLSFSIIVPVYNRPDEVRELLESLKKQTFKTFEVLIIEDGSTEKCEDVCDLYRSDLNIRYIFKANSGPGPSRNFGMEQAKGNYFIIFDSDCLIPEEYMYEVNRFLTDTYVDCYGGPDAAHDSFSDTQKSINYAMTSFFTTGGIRGGSEKLGKFQPRSFNMGLSRDVFEKVGGYGKIHPGEDPDLTFRIWEAGFTTSLIKKAHVYHKRRIDFQKFSKQIYKFGVVRVILNKWHPHSKKITYWFPTVFSIGFIGNIFLSLWVPNLIFFNWIYIIALFLDALIKTKRINIAVGAVVAAFIQFFSYGWGFLKSQFRINILNMEEKKAFPGFFFK